jgi:capsid portal protein
MRVLASGDGFVQARTGLNGIYRRRYFKRFGDARLMDKNTAEIGAWEQIARDDRASEVIHCREYDASIGGSGAWYGQPRWSPSYDAAEADNKVAQRQRAAVERSPGWANFFSIVNGGLDPKEYAEIKESIKNVSSGFRTVGRPLVFNPKKADGRRNADTRVTAQSLGSGLPETADSIALRKELREEIREGVGPSSIFLGAAGELSRASAAVSQRITVEQEWLPLLRSEEWQFNQIHRALGATRTVFRFARPRVTDDYQDSQILARLGVPSALTINQLLRLANRMVPGAHFATHINKWWADIPIIVLRTLLAIKGLGGPDADAGKLMDELLTLVEASAP